MNKNKVLKIIYYATTILLLLFCVLYIPILKGILDYHERVPDSYIDSSGALNLGWSPYYANRTMTWITLAIIIPCGLYRIIYRHKIIKDKDELNKSHYYNIDRVCFYVFVALAIILRGLTGIM